MDADWIAAKQALSLARRELWEAILATPYDALPPDLRRLRVRYDVADRHLRTMQRDRSRFTLHPEAARDE